MSITGTLVRFWEHGFSNEVAAEWVDWKDGWFHLAADDPLLTLVNKSARDRSLLLTVYSTDELVWTIMSTHIERDFATVHCMPWLTAARHSLLSDDYMVHLWLEAGRRYQESQI